MFQEFLNREIFQNRVADYLVFLIVLVAGIVIITIFKRVVLGRLKRWAKTTTWNIDEFIIDIIRKMLVPIAYYGVFLLASKNLALPRLLERAIEVAGMVLVFCFIALAAVARVKSRTPDRVGVDHGGIYLDQEYFPFAGLRRIQATPPDYGISQHNRLELLAADGRKRSVLLGLNSDRGKRPVFSEYPQFIALLQRAAAPWPGLLVMDLQ